MLALRYYFIFIQNLVDVILSVDGAATMLDETLCVMPFNVPDNLCGLI